MSLDVLFCIKQVVHWSSLSMQTVNWVTAVSVVKSQLWVAGLHCLDISHKLESDFFCGIVMATLWLSNLCINPHIEVSLCWTHHNYSTQNYYHTIPNPYSKMSWNVQHVFFCTFQKLQFPKNEPNKQLILCEIYLFDHTGLILIRQLKKMVKFNANRKIVIMVNKIQQLQVFERWCLNPTTL